MGTDLSDHACCRACCQCHQCRCRLPSLLRLHTQETPREPVSAVTCVPLVATPPCSALTVSLRPSLALVPVQAVQSVAAQPVERVQVPVQVAELGCNPAACHAA